jgi:DNA-directed RNA polymerase specialized sigma24 family protein
MNDRSLVDALQSREPGAVGAVYDAYADHLYAYCWFRLHDRDAAQVVLRDTFVVAEAHIHELDDADRFAAWLYTIARIECRRRLPTTTPEPDIPVASHDQDDVDDRLMAWNAVSGLPPLSRELLELAFHHELASADVALVVGRSAREVEELLDQTRRLLEDALIAEIVARQGSYGRDDQAVPKPGTISAAKVVGLLPTVTPPESARVRVMNYFTDPGLVGYRVLAAGRITGFTDAGFPIEAPAHRPARTVAVRGWARGLVAAGVAILLVGTVVAGFGWFGVHHGHAARTSVSAPSVQPHNRSLTTPTPPSAAPEPGQPTFPFGSRLPSTPPIALAAVPPLNFQSAQGKGQLLISPSRLDLGTGSWGTITLRAVGGDIDWRAAAGGPISLSISGGPMNRGDVATMTVRVARGSGAGSALIVFTPGGGRVVVDWDATAAPGPPATPPGRPVPPPTVPVHPLPPPKSPPPSEPPPSSPPATDPPSTPVSTAPAPQPSNSSSP